jgi:DTW domain-containing protein YfiP
MGQRERVTVINWPRSRDCENGEVGSRVWDAFLDNFDDLTDVMLFPDAKSALTVAEYVTVGNSWLGKRVVVLEASWNNSKAMFRKIQDGFVRRGQSPLKTIMLQNLVGTYWKFHHEGSSAVSTIEAIVHLLGEVACATDGAFDVEQFSTLLWLFEYDRQRLLSRLNDGQGKVPRTVEVRGTGIGSWKSYIS